MVLSGTLAAQDLAVLDRAPAQLAHLTTGLRPLVRVRRVELPAVRLIDHVLAHHALAHLGLALPALPLRAVSE